MKRSDLVDYINGSYLMKNYLQSFLAQSTYIEALLKQLADVTFWDKAVRENNQANLDYLHKVNSKIQNQGFYNLINFLFDTGFINKNQKSQLHAYREKRNKISHDLVRQMVAIDFDREIKELCELGNEIINDEDFNKMGELIDGYERRIDEIRNENRLVVA